MGAPSAVVGDEVTKAKRDSFGHGAVYVKTRFGKLTAPRGFGASYRRIAARHEQILFYERAPGKLIQAIQDVLGLIGYEVSVEAVADWDAQKRVEAHAYAYNVHARAGDNPLPRHPKLPWLPEPWKGPEQELFGMKRAGPTSLG